MNTGCKQIGLPRTFADGYSANRKGVRYVASSQGGGAAGLCVLCSIYASHFPARARADAGRDPLVAASHGHRRVAYRGSLGQGTLVRLPSSALSTCLVLLAAGQGAGGDGAGIDSRRSAGG